MKDTILETRLADMAIRKLFRCAGISLTIEEIIRRFIYDQKNLAPWWKFWQSDWKMVKNPRCATLVECKKYLLELLGKDNRVFLQDQRQACLLKSLEKIISSFLESAPAMYEIQSDPPLVTGGHPVFF